MRYWMIPPENLCRQHLLGCHSEFHKFRHMFVNKKSVKGWIFPKTLIEPVAMKQYHDDCAKEMLRRGYNHQSPYEMPDISYLPPDQRYAKVNIDQSFNDLSIRCSKCAQRMKGARNEQQHLHY